MSDDHVSLDRFPLRRSAVGRWVSAWLQETDALLRSTGRSALHRSPLHPDDCRYGIGILSVIKDGNQVKEVEGAIARQTTHPLGRSLSRGSSVQAIHKTQTAAHAAPLFTPLVSVCGRGGMPDTETGHPATRRKGRSLPKRSVAMGGQQ